MPSCSTTRRSPRSRPRRESARPSSAIWNAGVEFRRELALENETRVIPQVWYRFSPEAYLKAGVGKNLAGEKDTFVRVAVEIEF